MAVSAASVLCLGNDVASGKHKIRSANRANCNLDALHGLTQLLAFNRRPRTYFKFTPHDSEVRRVTNESKGDVKRADSGLTSRVAQRLSLEPSRTASQNGRRRKRTSQQTSSGTVRI